MKPVSENDLRKWLASVWERGKRDIGVQWIEPAAGSSVGFPDALLPVWPSLLPVELKIAHRTPFDTFQCHVRPVQRRFHLLMREANMFSAFLIAEGDKQSFNVWASHNTIEPWNNNAEPGEILVASKQTTNATIDRANLESIFLQMMNAHNQVMLQVPGNS